MMFNKTCPLSMLTVGSTNWSTQVLLIEKTCRRKTKTPGREWQRYIFIDDLLFVDKEMQWVLTASNVMEEDMENALDLSLSFPIFTPFTDLGKYIGTLTNLDIIGIVIDKSAGRKVNTQQVPATIQDLVLISQEKIPVILSLWNDFITTEGDTAIASVGKFPILVVLRARVQSFRGTSLSAKGFATLLDEPPFPETISLLEWQSLNQPYLATLIKSKPYFTNSSSRSSLVLQQQSTIAELITATKEDHFTVLGRAKLDAKFGPHYYIACPECLKQTTVAANQLYNCHTCREKQVATPRAKYNIIIYDNLTKLVVVGFGNVAETVAGITIQELLACKLEDGSLNIQTINSKQPNNQFLFQIRKKHSGAITSGNFFYNLVACTPMPQSPPTETRTDFGPGSSQTNEVIFTAEIVSNKCDSPVAYHSFDKGKKSCTNTTLSRKTAKISSTTLLARSATDDANNIKVGDIIVDLDNNLGASQNDVDNFAQSTQ